MENKKRFKLYKSGKLWCCAAIAFATLAIGSATVEIAHADATVPADQQVTTVTSASLTTNTASASQATIQSTTQTSNRVPQDTTTTNNQINANEGHLDNTQITENQQTGATTLNASGWHATGQSNNEPYRYVILYDNTTQHEIQREKVVPQTRPDVQQAYPHIDNSFNSGFNVHFTLPNNLAGHSISLVARYSTDAINGEGQHTDYWFSPIILNNDNRASLDSLTSDQDGNLHVSGWHASNQAWGKKYHYIIAYDQTTGREITRQKVTDNQTRYDVADAFPSITNAAFSGFNVFFKLSPQYARDNIQFISRWTDDAAGNGNYIDYWFGPVVKNNCGNLDTWDISTGNLQVSGWHADDISIYEPYHYLILFDNTTGTQVASKKVDTMSSDDVAKVYGNDTRSANKSRFNTIFDGITLTDGHTYSLISRYSVYNGGNGDDGNGADHTDYWYPGKTYSGQAYSIDSWQPTNNSMQLSGWFANDAAVNYKYAYVILLDGQGELGRQRVDLTQRADVAKAYPELYNSLNSGFVVTINFDRAVNGDLQVVLRFTNDPYGNGSHTVDIYTDKYSTNAGNFDNLIVKKDYIDISGWHAADNLTNKPYQYIIAMDSNTHQEITRWNVTDSATTRHDVKNAYPWIVNSAHSGFSLNTSGIDLTANRAGVYFIHRYTDDSAGNGNYVDYDSDVVYFIHYNMYANSINAFIANNHIGHATIEVRHILNVPGSRSGILTGPGSGSTQYIYGKPVKVIVHETANPNDSIEGEINYESNHYEDAFVHAFVDGNRIVEIAPTDRPSWGSVNGNPYGVQFEQVEVYGRDNFARELVNAAYYAAYEMKQYGMIPSLNGGNGTLMSHHMVSQYLGGTDHTDPDGYWTNRALNCFGTNYTMSDFFELVKYEYTQL